MGGRENNSHPASDRAEERERNFCPVKS